MKRKAEGRKTGGLSVSRVRYLLYYKKSEDFTPCGQAARRQCESLSKGSRTVLGAALGQAQSFGPGPTLFRSTSRRVLTPFLSIRDSGVAHTMGVLKAKRPSHLEGLKK